MKSIVEIIPKYVYWDTRRSEYFKSDMNPKQMRIFLLEHLDELQPEGYYYTNVKILPTESKETEDVVWVINIEEVPLFSNV